MVQPTTRWLTCNGASRCPRTSGGSRYACTSSPSPSRLPCDRGWAGGPQNDRLSELLKGEKWEEPIARPKGRAREDVLLAALEDVMRDARNKHEAEAKKSEQVTRAASPPRRPRASAPNPASAHMLLAGHRRGSR